MHWLRYHSKRKMGHDYDRRVESAVYSKREPSKLCDGDVIWVIEGPNDFQLVDCFRLDRIDDPPFKSAYRDFKVKFSGSSLMGPSSYLLNGSGHWFDDILVRFIRKPNPLVPLSPDHILGLEEVSGLRF
jgi:hypothetical protein